MNRSVTSLALTTAVVLAGAPAASAATCASDDAPALTGEREALRLALPDEAPDRASVSVVQHATGSQLTGARVVTRLAARDGVVAWDREARSGLYALRFRTDGETREIVLRRARGRWTLRPAAEAPACGLVKALAADRPVFRGADRRTLTLSYRLARSAKVRIDVLRQGRVVTSTSAVERVAGANHRLLVRSGGFRPGEYRFRLTATRGGETTTASVVSRAL